MAERKSEKKGTINTQNNSKWMRIKVENLKKYT